MSYIARLARSFKSTGLLATEAVAGEGLRLPQLVRTPRPRPVDLVSPWPHGETTDPAGSVADAFASRLQAAVGDRSIRSVVAECHLNHQTVHAILAGEVWPDMYTIAHLESGLRTPLWPATTRRPVVSDVGTTA